MRPQTVASGVNVVPVASPKFRLSSGTSLPLLLYSGFFLSQLINQNQRQGTAKCHPSSKDTRVAMCQSLLENPRLMDLGTAIPINRQAPGGFAH